jgi:hypothetical protein
MAKILSRTPEGWVAPCLLLDRLGQRQADCAQAVDRLFRHGVVLVIAPNEYGFQSARGKA